VWGHDFRPDYLHVAQAHRDLGAPPILAMTATAPPRVRQDIERQLFGPALTGDQPARMRLIATDSFRPNLQLHVIKARNEDGKLQHLLALCGTLTGSGIVYARTRQRCEELADLLRRHGVNADHYHAGIANRTGMQERFMDGRTAVMVATIAFGMGIDKADIRFIIHYGLPDSVESYYQEIGRAGRDGQPARCILLYGNSDKGMLTQHANQDQLDVDFLRNVYRTVRTHLQGRNPGTVALGDLVRDLQIDDTKVRVALSVLEQVGLLKRDYDTPRTVTLQWQSGAETPAFTQFAAQARLLPNQTVTRPLLEIATLTQIPAQQLERELLAWQGAGLLRYHAGERDLLLTLPPAPAQAAANLDSLLDQYATIQHQRVAEIVDYARSRYCRHGYLANYLGGAARTQCTVCDNCGATALPSGEATLPTENEQFHLILTALDKQGWGRRNLIGLLRGDGESGERAQGSPVFGKLGFRSESALGKLIDALVNENAVAENTLSHGGVALGITPHGRKILHTDESLAHLVSAPTPVPLSNSTSSSLVAIPPDSQNGVLLTKLQNWRNDLARTQEVPPYVIASNAVLQEIATLRPTSLEQLGRIKGIGPAKLAQYGAAILEVIQQTAVKA
ncbi:MAG: HRDC domain-containing protein, partial [Chloroflexota bacterium]|nr:HRDC domain-containing protein [Chloroflexota bacterium]